MRKTQKSRSGVFISYSHADAPLLERLKVFLAPFERGGVFNYWDDRRIEPGMNWRAEIRRALDNAKVAILLISADFLASEFVREHELPALLHAAKQGGTVILPVIVGPSAFSEIEGLSELEAVNDPKKPLKKLSGVQRDDVFNELANRVVHVLGATGIAPSGSRTAGPGAAAAARAKAGAPKTRTTAWRGVDHSLDMNPVRDQGAEGSALGFALAAAIEYQVWKKTNRRVVMSPRHIYYLARVETGQDVGVDAGARLSDGISALMRSAVVVEGAWPYEPGEYARKMPAGLKRAESYKLRESHLVRSVDDIKRALRDTGPVVGGVTIYQSMASAAVRDTGVVPMPDGKDRVWGGHALCLVGYDDGKELFKFRNSWGARWGDHGYGYMSYSYARRFASEVWAVCL